MFLKHLNQKKIKKRFENTFKLRNSFEYSALEKKQLWGDTHPGGWGSMEANGPKSSQALATKFTVSNDARTPCPFSWGNAWAWPRGLAHAKYVKTNQDNPECLLRMEQNATE